MAQGRNHKALVYFSQAYRVTRSMKLDLNIALAHCRLGDLDKARLFYARAKNALLDAEPQKEFCRKSLPGTANRDALESSIFFARGAGKDATRRDSEALSDYQAALRLSPRNALIASQMAGTLRNLDRDPEAARAFAIAATYGTGEIAKEATYQLPLRPNGEREQALAEAAKLKCRQAVTTDKPQRAFKVL
ncbi:MAG: hypothetical protein JWN98_2130 [Abditibacteriota bacterium]|nr:hypothetical protein [Abditibacteriota bacterium]